MKTSSFENREKIVGITVSVRSSDGKIRDIEIDPESTEALFWSDRAVLEIFSPFYNNSVKFSHIHDLISHAGSEVEALLPRDSTSDVKITGALVEAMWDQVRSDGQKMAFIAKAKKCIPQAPPAKKSYVRSSKQHLKVAV